MSVTSIEAYKGTRKRDGTFKGLVFAVIEARGAYGATDDELQQVLNADSQSLCPARLSLERDGIIFFSGRTRKTRDNFEAMVWVAAQHPHAPRRPELTVHNGYCAACGRGSRKRGA